MGAGVSSWRLAQAVSRLGQLGVVSGTALDQIFARRLQDGDPGGHMRRGLDHFPFPVMAERAWRKFYIPGGKLASASYKTLPMHIKDTPRELASFASLLILLKSFLLAKATTIQSESTIWKKFRFRICLLCMARCSPVLAMSSWARAFR